MSEIVYLFGAGINRVINDRQGLRPPLAKDLFQQVLNQDRITLSGYNLEARKPLFDYIDHYFKFSMEKLRTEEFDLESCYTLIQLQAMDARLKNNENKLILLNEIESQLTNLFVTFLSTFDTFFSEAFRVLGQIIYSEKSTVLTFNYDTLLESAIESASGVNHNTPSTFFDTAFRRIKIPDEEVAYSHHKWNRPLAYGVQFDEVQLQRAGNRLFVTGERFYSHPDNKLYDAPLLKLHGSINWFDYTGIKTDSFRSDKDHETNAGKTVLFDNFWMSIRPPELNGEILSPKIITPVLYKEFTSDPIISQVWQRAYQELLTCKTLIVGGYSFPPSDFNTKRLFLEAFADNSLDELIVINPDPSVAGIVKNLCHFNKPVTTCNSLNEFISLFVKIV